MSVATLRQPDHKRYSSPAAHLYDRIDVENGVRVAGRLCKLVIARESGCMVLYQTGRRTGGYGKDGKSQAYEPMVEVPLESVVEA